MDLFVVKSRIQHYWNYIATTDVPIHDFLDYFFTSRPTSRNISAKPELLLTLTIVDTWSVVRKQ